MLRAVYDEQQVRRAQSKFLDGHDLPKGLIPLSIQRSWERLRQSGALPGDRAMFYQEQLPGHPQAGTERDALLQAALPEMEALHRSLNSSAWSVLCVDLSGTIIGALCDERSAPKEIINPLRPGRSVRESDVGTNAPACVLTDREPIIVQRAEHFLAELNPYVCAAAPIFDVTGRIAGVLDVTGAVTRLQDALLDQVRLTARAIENRLFNGMRDICLLGLHFMPAYLGTSAEGLIAFREDRLIQAVNDAACRMLGRRRDELIGLHIDAVFTGLDYGAAESGEEVKSVLCANGRRLFVRDCGPQVRRKSYSPLRQPLVVRPHKAEPFSRDEAVAKALNQGSRAVAKGLPLMIRGETGCGKEVLAREIHSSFDASSPFVAVNCSAIPESLMEAELFGYADGAFTGARKGGAKGAIEEANGGLLFLDEIGDAPPSLQAKLLRVLQESALTRLGSRQEINLDLKVISATHRDLKAMIAAGSFREDLFYRLNGLTVSIPPIRERRDLGELIDGLLSKLANGAPAPHLTAETRNLLMSYHWPGNVRQLAQALAAAVALCDDPQSIATDDLPVDLVMEIKSTAGCDRDPALGGSLVASQAECVRRTLSETRGNVSAAARRLGISRTTLYKYLGQQPQAEAI